MKRLILLAGSMLVIFQITAQELSGSVFVTAGLGATSQKDERGNTSKTLQISPSVNYMLNEHWSLGLFAEYDRSAVYTKMVLTAGSGYYNTNQKYEIKNHSLVLGPQVRYYQPVASKFFFFGEAQTGLQFEKQEIDESYIVFYNNAGDPIVANGGSNSDASALSAQVNLSPGLVYFIKPKFSIEFKTNLVSYNHVLENSKLPKREAAASRDFKIDLSMANTSLGASYYF